MRRAVILIFLAVVVVGCKRSSTRCSQLLVIPQPPQCIINKVENGFVVPLGTVNFPRYEDRPEIGRYKDSLSRSLHEEARAYDRIATSTEGWIASVVETGNKIGIARVDESERIVAYPDIIVPSKMNVHSIVLEGEILFVGGGGGKELLGYYNLADAVPYWNELYVPDSIKADGKAIDCLLISGNTLIAIDDIVIPKWVLLYDVGEAGTIEFVEIKELPTHGVYEWIFSAKINDKWLAVLSGTSPEFALCEHVALYDIQSLAHLADVNNCTFQSRWFGYQGARNDTVTRWESIAIYGDRLLIASGSRGIGIVDMNKAHKPPADQDTPAISTNYVLPHSLVGSEVLSIYPVEISNALTILAINDGKLLACSVPISDVLSESH